MDTHEERDDAMIRRGAFDASQAFEDAWRARGRGRNDVADAEVRDLVRTAELICRSAVAEPSTEFRTALRARLMAEAVDVLVNQPAAPTPVRVRTTTSPYRRRLAGLAAAVVASVGSVGMIASSASAIPGDMLYPVKRGVENFQIAFHRDDASRGEYRLQQARERLAEAQALDSRGDAERLAATLEDFTAQAESGTDDLFAAYESDQTDTNIETVNNFVADASMSLASLSSAVPTDARDSFTSATTLLTGLADQAAQLCSSCSAVDISSLVNTISSMTGHANGTATLPDTSAPTKTTEPTVGITVPQVQPTAVAPKPSPKPTTTGGTTAGLGEAIGGTLDAVVGDDGIVGGLLNGLLGGGKK